MSEIADLTKTDIQLCNYHLKKMVAEGIIKCTDRSGSRRYSVHPIIRKSDLYSELFEIMTRYVPEFFDELQDSNVMVECIRQVLLLVLKDIEDIQNSES